MRTTGRGGLPHWRRRGRRPQRRRRPGAPGPGRDLTRPTSPPLPSPSLRENGTYSSRERYLFVARTVLIARENGTYLLRGVCSGCLWVWVAGVVAGGIWVVWFLGLLGGPLVVCWPGFVCVSRSETQVGWLPRLRWGPGRARRRKGLSGRTSWPRRDPGPDSLTCVDIERTKVQVGWAQSWVPDCDRTRHPAPPGPCKPPVAGGRSGLMPTQHRTTRAQAPVAEDGARLRTPPPGLPARSRTTQARDGRSEHLCRSHDEQVPFSRQTSTVLTANKYRSRGEERRGRLT